MFDINTYKPTKEFLVKVEKLAEAGIQVEMVGPLVDLTNEEMEALYSNNRDVRLCYQRGISKLNALATKKITDMAFKDEDFKALEYLSTNIAGVKKEKGKKDTVKAIAPESTRNAFNPALLLDNDKD